MLRIVTDCNFLKIRIEIILIMYEGHHWTKLKFSICPTFSSFVAKNSNLVQYYFQIISLILFVLKNSDLPKIILIRNLNEKFFNANLVLSTLFFFFERSWFRSIRAIFNFFLHAFHGLSTSNSLLSSFKLTNTCDVRQACQRCQRISAANVGAEVSRLGQFKVKTFAGATTAVLSTVLKTPTILYPLAEETTKWVASFFSVL